MKSFLGSEIGLCKLVSSQWLDLMGESEDDVLSGESSIQLPRRFEICESQPPAPAPASALRQNCEILLALEVGCGILRAGPPRDDLHL